MTMLNTITKREARAFINAYLVCALWSSTDYRSDPDSRDYDPEAGENMDDSFSPDDATRETLSEAREDLFDFLRQCNDAGIDLRAVNSDLSQHAHDLWLTRNHHGAGFWDRGYGESGEHLTQIAHYMGSRDCFALTSDQFIID